MIELITGQPGSGKTLFTLATVHERAKREGRAVYFSGVAELRLPGWIELEDATKWMDVPDGSIIVIDEAQRVFRPRHYAGAVPAHVEGLETHRHRGLDLYFVTQHPSLVETNVRRLVGVHHHVMRAFGAKLATVHSWNEVRTDCDTSRADSMQKPFAYPAELFKAYKSAEVHTHKRRIPMRAWLLLLIPVGLLVLGSMVYDRFKGMTDAGATAKGSAAQHGPPGGGAAGPGSVPKPVKIDDGSEWLRVRQPRVPGMPQTAPVYDGVTAAAVAPYPAACISSASRCRCYTQQGTVIDTSDSLCRSIVQRGFFVDWAQGGASVGVAGAAPTSGQPAARPVSGAPEPWSVGAGRAG